MIKPGGCRNGSISSFPNMDVEGATLLDTLEEEAEQPAEHEEQAETAKSTMGASS